MTCGVTSVRAATNLSSSGLWLLGDCGGALDAVVDPFVAPPDCGAVVEGVVLMGGRGLRAARDAGDSGRGLGALDEGPVFPLRVGRRALAASLSEARESLVGREDRDSEVGGG